MKIPEFNIEQLAPPGGGRAPELRIEKPDGFGELANSFQQAGRAVDEVAAAAQKADQQAVATDVANAMAQLETKSTNALHGNPMGVADGTTPDDAFDGGGQDTGFLGLRGKDAAAASTSTFADLDEARQKIAKGLNDRRAQELFNLHAGQLMRQNQTIIESHVKQQNEVAFDDGLKNLQDAAVHAGAMDPDLDLAASLRIANIAGVASVRGRDFEDRVVRDTAQRVTSARLDTLLKAADVAASKGDLDGARQNHETAERVFEDNKPVLGEHLAHYYGAVFEQRNAATDEATIATHIVKGAIRGDGSVDEGKLYEGISQVAEQAPTKLKGVNQFVAEQATLARKAYAAGTENLMSQAQAAFNTQGWTGMPPELKKALNDRKYDERAPKQYDTLYAEFLRRSKMGRESKSQQQKDQLAFIADAVNDFNGYPDDIKATMDLSPTGQFAQEHPGLLHAVEGVPDGLKKLKPLQQQADTRLQKNESAPLERMISQTVGELEKGGEGAFLTPGRTPQEKLEYQRRLKDVRSQAIEAWTAAASKGTPSQDAANEMTARIVLSHGIANKVQGETAARAAITLGAPKPPAPRRQLSFGDRLKQLQAQKVPREQARKIMEAEGFDLKTGTFRTAAPAPSLAPEPDEDTPPIPGED